MANKRRLDTTMETDFLQSFVAGSLATTSPADKPQKQATTEVEKTVRIAEPPQSQTVCTKFLASEAKCAKPKKPAGKRKSKRRTAIKSEELYTDKDRAAAVNLGTRDIKQSLKMKRAQDRSRAMHIPEEADPAQFLTLGHYELKRNETRIALGFINKALELNPNEKHALVARSKCYILLGQPQEGLKDAEAALQLDRRFLKGIYQKAEALYYLGDFEHALMYFHRGLHIRPDHEECKMGVEKAQKAIETALGVGVVGHRRRSKSAVGLLASKPSNDDNNNSVDVEVDQNQNVSKNVRKERSRSSIARPAGAKLLKELAVDKEYLESLLKHPDLKETTGVLAVVQDTVEYLNRRQEFWRQQVPPLF